MNEAIIVAVISGIFSLIGIYLANSYQYRKIMVELEKAQLVTDTKLDELTKNVEKHNSMVERTYLLEQRSAVLEEQIKVANHRIGDLEHR